MPGVEAGHWTHPDGTTGVTAILFPQAARASVWVPGSATGTRERGVLDPGHLAGRIHGLCLAGGSAFGLAAAQGVVDVLCDRDIGFETPFGKVPIVPAAILFDLAVGSVKPGPNEGRHAALAASPAPLLSGRVGAGAGATVGKASGVAPERAGFGGWAETVDEHTVGVGVALNAFGSVRDPQTGAWIGGAPVPETGPVPPPLWRTGSTNTTLVAVVTDAPLDNSACQVVAKMASAGMARCIEPAFAPFDGDIVFVASTAAEGRIDPFDILRVGHAAAHAIERAIVGVFASGPDLARPSPP